MSTNSENRDLEVLFEEVMPGYLCIVTRQAQGAINLQFESLTNQRTITLPAPSPDLWDTPEKLQEMCEQISEEFLVLWEEESPASPDHPAAPIQVTSNLAEKLYAILQALNSQKGR
ncbi:hypothetical protein D9M68_318540 [compost metagenome]